MKFETSCFLSLPPAHKLLKSSPATDLLDKLRPFSQTFHRWWRSNWKSQSSASGAQHRCLSDRSAFLWGISILARGRCADRTVSVDLADGCRTASRSRNGGRGSAKTLVPILYMIWTKTAVENQLVYGQVFCVWRPSSTEAWRFVSFQLFSKYR